MITLGTTLRCNLPPRHIWVVISDPARTGNSILLVNLTTLRDDSVDDVCVLDAPDFALLSHPTTVAYSRAQPGTVAALTSLIQDGSFTLVTSIPPATLQRILTGARASQELSEAHKKLVG